MTALDCGDRPTRICEGTIMSDRRNPLGVTRLLGLQLTPGKLRGLQRICNDNGTLTMVATDQNSSIISLMKDAHKKKGELNPKNSEEGRDPTYQEIVEAKIVLASALAPVASAILVDGYYGVWNSVASFSIPPRTGVLVRVEKSGGTRNPVGAPLMDIEPGWGVAKIKRCGADAVKLLAPYEPTEPASAEHQYNLVQKVYQECQKHDILMLLETIAFPFGGEKKDSREYRARRGATVIESARQLSRFCDIYKAEFPGHLGMETESQLRDNLKALNAASERPWVLLSAGVDFPDYKRQVEMALDCGASGVLGGRAFWKEFFLQDGAAAREKFAHTEAVERVRQVDALVQSKATPWFNRYGLSVEQLQSIRAAEGWHFRYGGGKTESSGSGEWGY
jgi:tagatose 1,6-diphosphate aldolase